MFPDLVTATLSKAEENMTLHFPGRKSITNLRRSLFIDDFDSGENISSMPTGAHFRVHTPRMRLPLLLQIALLQSDIDPFVGGAQGGKDARKELDIRGKGDKTARGSQSRGECGYQAADGVGSRLWGQEEGIYGAVLGYVLSTETFFVTCLGGPIIHGRVLWFKVTLERLVDTKRIQVEIGHQVAALVKVGQMGSLEHWPLKQTY